MSKNIYRVNKKSDLDEIMKNNFLKPVCIIFVSKNTDNKLYDDITTSILAVSKNNTYNMTILIDFDDFLDNNGFFDSIKTNVPYFLAFFRGKNISSIDNKDNFIPLIVNKMEEIHQSYISKLSTAFAQTNEIPQEPTVQNDVHVSKNVVKDNQSISSKSSNSSKSSSSKSNSSTSSKISSSSKTSISSKTSSSKSSKSSKSEKKSLKSNDTEKIKRDKEKLKKLKELQKLQSMLNNK